MNITKQAWVGFLIVAILIVLGLTGVYGDDVSAFPRLLIGLAIGYVLARGVFGFAGMANRTFRSGNGNLIVGMMFVIMLTSVMVGGLLLLEAKQGVDIISLNQYPISLGLFAGGILFGIGMAFSSCCATGVLQELVGDPLRGFTVMLFFAIGVLVGFPLKSTDFVSKAIIGSDDGISLLDIVSGPVDIQIFVAIVITVILSLVVIYLTNIYQKKVHFVPQIKIEQEESSTFDKVFVKPFPIATTAFFISILVILIFFTYGKGWSASSVAGYWLATLLSVFGVSAEALNEYAGKTVVISVFTDPSSLQNIGIILGTLVALLLSNSFVDKVKASVKKRPQEYALFALGGFMMGFGTRLSMGCNVGAFLTPAVGFSVSGWVYFVVLIAAGYIGNKLFKLFYSTLK